MISLEIKKSSVDGDGVFAKENITNGENMGLGFEKVENTGNPDTDYMRTNLGEKINHSKDSNVRLFQDNNKFYFFSSRDIQQGEELLLDYESIPWDGKRGF